MQDTNFEGHQSESGDLLPELIAPAAPMVESDADPGEQGQARRQDPEPELSRSICRAEFSIFERLDYLWRTHRVYQRKLSVGGR